MARPWTATETATLRQLWGREPYRQVAQKLNRPPTAVATKASKLGLKSDLNRAPRHDYDNIKEMIEFGYHATQIAIEHNTSTKTIYNTVRDSIGSNWYKMLLKNTKLQNKEYGRRTPVITKQYFTDSDKK